MLLPVALYLVRSVSTVRTSDQFRALGIPLAIAAAMLLVVLALHLIADITATALLLAEVPLTLAAHLAVVLPFRRGLVMTC